MPTAIASNPRIPRKSGMGDSVVDAIRMQPGEGESVRTGPRSAESK
jgi:hypothetical protein